MFAFYLQSLCLFEDRELGNNAETRSLAGRSLKRRRTMLGTILLVVVILLLLGALPTWPHSRQWGYYPSGGLGLILLILLILLLSGRL
jgi:cytoskeletal protein RodZ